MLRPQVFALQQGPIPIGLAASEKQAIDATLQSLAHEDSRFWSCADYYWNARGGSHTDGGAFSFTVTPKTDGTADLVCTDKFGRPIHTHTLAPQQPINTTPSQALISFPDLPAHELFAWVRVQMREWDYSIVQAFLNQLIRSAQDDASRQRAIDVLKPLLDRHYPLGAKRRSCLLAMIQKSLIELFESMQSLRSAGFAYLTYGAEFPYPQSENQTLIVNAHDFPAEGPQSLALAIVEMYSRGYSKMIIYDCQGQRFIANGLGVHSHRLHVDIFGSAGDYLASGIDGATVHVHGSGQDQLAQIMKAGTLVVHGDVGQTFMYGAKGGKAFVKGNTAGRPLIYIVGTPRVVINGTCLDYLAESCMAGNPLQGGGFVIVNGIRLKRTAPFMKWKPLIPAAIYFH